MLAKLPIVILLAAAAAAQAQTARLVGDLPRKDDRALQALPGLETEYGSVRTSEGFRLRTILTRPAGSARPLPAILLAQWVSCGSIDASADRPSLLRDIAEQSGMVFVRIERAGTGDSEGPPCSGLDYDTEVRHYREALDKLARHPWVDPGRIVIFGNSLGATTAPLIAEGRKVAGIVVQGGGAVTYVERMIGFDRLYLERSGRYRPEQIHEEMVRRIAFHVEYLLGRKTPERIARERPDLAGVWATIRGAAEAPPHYGRPYAWHWQAASTDFLEAWTKVQAPVLVLYGEYDQFERRHGHQLIADTINRLRPGSATFLEIPQADHELELYASAEDAYAYRDPEVRRELWLQPMIDWVRRVTAAAVRPASSRR
jgi:pimeloyl-ACP methyl ester carboxylesterase